MTANLNPITSDGGFNTSADIVAGGNVNVTGNITSGGNIDIDGEATVGGNLIIVGNITFSGGGSITEVTSAYGNFYGNADGSNALYAGYPGGVVVPGGITSFTGDSNSYMQINAQNRNHGTQASIEYVITGDLGTDTTDYIDMGFASSSWDGTQTNSLGNAVGARDGYLYVQGGGGGGNLVLGVTTASRSIKFVAGGPNSGNIVANITNNGFASKAVYTDNYYYANGSPLAIPSGNTSVTTTGNVSAGNISSTGNVTAGALIGDGGNISNIRVGNVAGLGNIATLNLTGSSSNVLYGNGVFAPQTGGGGSYGNSNVATFLASYGSNTITTTGNISAGNLSLSGLVTITGNANIGNIGTAGVVSATGNVRGGNINTDGIVSAVGNITGGNLITTGIVSATGNITGNFFIGNGSQLTGLPSSYSNANVANYLPTYTGTLTSVGAVTANGTITGNNFQSNGNIVIGTALNIWGSNNTIGTTNGSAVQFGNRVNFNATGVSLSATGNIGGGNLISGGLITATGNITGGNIITAGIISATGNITANNLGNVSALVLDGSSSNVLYGNGTFAPGAGGSSISNGTSNINIATSGGNVQIVSGGNIIANISSANFTVNSSNLNVFAGRIYKYGGLTATAWGAAGAGFVSSSATYTDTSTPAGTQAVSYIHSLSGGTLAFSNAVTVTTAAGLSVSAPTAGTNATIGTSYAIISQGAFSATGNISTGGLITATGNITGGNIATAGLITSTGNITGGNLVTAGQVSATGNVNTSGTFVGNGAGLTNVTFNQAGNIVGPGSNVSLIAGSYTYTFDNTGNFVLPTNGDLVFSANTTLTSITGTNGNVTVNPDGTGQFVLTSITPATFGNSLTVAGPVISTGSGNAVGFLVGNSAVNNVAVGFSPTAGTAANMAIRDLSTVTSVMYFDVVAGSTSTGTFLFRTSNAYTQLARIDTYGLTLPTRPAFRVYGNGSQSITSGNVIANAIVDYNQASSYVNTSGTFTAPVAGLYQVFLNVRAGSTASLSQAGVFKNGQVSAGNVCVFWEITTSATQTTHFGESGIVKLAAGDTLTAKCVAGSITFDSNDSWGAAFIG